MDFPTLGLPPPLLQALEELGFRTLTPVQAECLPPALAARDLVAQSRTGSGKTAAFSLPILARMSLEPRRLQALVLCPTRELAAQVARDMRRLGRHLAGLHVLVVAGGEPVWPQISALEKGVHVVVGTPGRVLDLLGRGALDISEVRTLVLDEADRMLDMGFRDDIAAIVSHARPERQSMLFSATFPPEIETLAKSMLREPVRVLIESKSEESASIRQVAYACDGISREELLVRLIRRLKPASAIVFCNQKAVVTEVTRVLSAAGIRADGLHGDLEQSDRDRVLAKFRNQSTRVLVATDVAARGLDVESVEVVFNFHVANSPDSHVHRVGRTGRAGRSGLAVSLVNEREREKLSGYAEFSLESEPDEEPEAIALEAPMATVFIGAGRKEKMRPGDIMGALTGAAGGLEGSEVGKIEIHDHHAWVAVSRARISHAIEKLREVGIKGRKPRIDRMR